MQKEITRDDIRYTDLGRTTEAMSLYVELYRNTGKMGYVVNFGRDMEYALKTAIQLKNKACYVLLCCLEMDELFVRNGS
jgi:hypothetical protein